MLASLTFEGPGSDSVMEENDKTCRRLKLKKSSKLARASGTAVRNDESADESDTAADQQISPDGLEDFLFSARARNDRSVVAPNKFGALIPATDSVGMDELEATLAAVPADFQTVTKKHNNFIRKFWSVQRPHLP